MGGGPSLNNIDFNLIKHRRIIGINNAYGDPVLDGNGFAKKDSEGRFIYTPRDWVDACWFCDGRWYSWHYRSLKEFSGIIAHCVPRCFRNGTHYFVRGKPRGLESREGCVAWNGNAGMSAVNFAYHLGVKRVILLGFDMRRVDDRPNWHNDHPSLQKNPYFRFLRSVDHVHRDAILFGLDVVNCTPGSAITQWPIMSLERYLDLEALGTEDFKDAT